VVEPAGATGIETRALRHDAAHIERRQRADGGARVRRQRCKARAALAARETPLSLGACGTNNIRRRRLASSLEDLLEKYTPLVKLTDEEKDLLARRTRSVGLLA